MTADPASDGLQAERIAAQVAEILDLPDEWMTTEGIVEYTHFAVQKIRVELRSGSLHCHRRGDRGFPRARRAVVRAWLQGATPDQQAEVCGCRRFHRWSR